MKNIHPYFRSIALLLVISSTVTISSCKKYLSPTPLSTLDPSIAFSNIPNALATVNGAYLSMAGDFGYGIRVSYYYAYDDDCIMGGGSGTGVARQDEAHSTLTAGNTDIVTTFNQFYAGIEKANNCIYYIPKMPQYTTGSPSDQAALQRMVGESMVIRAQYLFDLIRIWGDVPAHWVPSAFVPNLFESRTNRDTIYAHLLSDLALAKTLMPWRTAVAQDERFTKGTAMALRAKIALFAGGYSLRQSGQLQRPANYLDYYAITRAECDTLMQNRAQHTLYPTFKGFWKDVVDAHKAVDASGELIMQVAMANGTNSDSKIGAQSGTKINGVGGSLGNMQPTYFYFFDSTDVRRDVTFVPFEVVRDVYGRGHASNSIYDGKFRRDWITNPSYYQSAGPTNPPSTNPLTLTPASNTAIQNFQLNWPLIRFADILLMYAETDNEISGSPGTAAVNAWKEVALRGHNGNVALLPVVPPDHDGFFKLLVRERALEFGAEGIRKYDLIRWGLLGKALAETKANLVNFAAGTALNNPTYMAPFPSYCTTTSLPKSMFFYQNKAAENLSATQSGSQIWANSFYNPAPASAPADSTMPQDPVTHLYPAIQSANKVNWFANANVTTTYVNWIGFGFVTGKSELYPIPQASIDADGSLRPQNPGY